jgi:two-component system sensor histidine kinase SenX3
MTLALVIVAAALVLLLGVQLLKTRSLRRELATAHTELRRAADDHGAVKAELGQLRDRGDGLTHALHALDLGVIVVDEAGAVVFQNSAAVGLTAFRQGTAQLRAGAAEAQTVALGGEQCERDVQLHGASVTTYRIRAFPLTDQSEDATRGALVLIEDTTRRYRIDQVRRDFVANISHELRTPIGAIGLLAETILDEEDPAVLERLSARMVDEADRVARTIDDLLELTRIEFGDDTSIATLPLAEVLGEVEIRLAAAAEQAGVDVVTHAAPGLTVNGDRRQLVSAVFNLADNAIKYSPRGESVLIEAALVGDEVLITVTDRGIGIPQSDVARVFERFYRVDRARSRVTGGTGLGLAIVRHVAGNHGGRVAVESREGVGSVFIFALPATPHLGAPPAGNTRGSLERGAVRESEEVSP